MESFCGIYSFSNLSNSNMQVAENIPVYLCRPSIYNPGTVTDILRLYEKIPQKTQQGFLACRSYTVLQGCLTVRILDMQFGSSKNKKSTTNIVFTIGRRQACSHLE